MTEGPFPVEVRLSGELTLRGHEWPVVGPPVVFLHEVGRDLDSWGTIPAKVAAEGFRVLSMDLSGHGLSDGKPDAESLPRDTVRLMRAVEAMRGPCGLVVCGTSARGAARVGSDTGAPVQVLVSPRSLSDDELAISRPAIRLVVVGAGDPQYQEEAKRVYDRLRGQRMLGSAAAAEQGVELLLRHSNVLEDAVIFLRRYLAPTHMRWVREQVAD